MSRGGFGAPPTIRALPRVSRTATIELVASYGDQGISDSDATLIALGPTSDAIRYVSDAIALDHTNGPCEIVGKIRPVTRDETFDVQFSGTYHVVSAMSSPRASGHFTAAPPTSLTPAIVDH